MSAALLHRAAEKADPRRFFADPEAPTGFGDLPVQYEAEVEPPHTKLLRLIVEALNVAEALDDTEGLPEVTSALERASALSAGLFWDDGMGTEADVQADRRRDMQERSL